MEQSDITKLDHHEELTRENHGEFEEEEKLQDLPKMKGLMSTGENLFLYEGFWIPEFLLKSVVSFQKHFVARDTDLILASSLKSGTTWLMALAFSIVNRTRFKTHTNSPLLVANPHDIVTHLEIKYVESESPNFEDMIPNFPRLFHTHFAYELLPPCIKSSSSACKIVYICRNPMDLFVSLWHFVPKFRSKNTTAPSPPHDLGECFDMFCRGIHDHGPYFDHVLGFWKASLESPHKVLFLRYEDLKEDCVFHVKRLAEFLGFPFSEEEEKRGVIMEIIELCSFGNMKNLNPNTCGTNFSGIPNSAFFRKGEVGDRNNHLTPSMIECMEKLVQEKFKESHFRFK